MEGGRAVPCPMLRVTILAQDKKLGQVLKRERHSGPKGQSVVAMGAAYLAAAGRLGELRRRAAGAHPLRWHHPLQHPVRQGERHEAEAVEAVKLPNAHNFMEEKVKKCKTEAASEG